MRLQDTPASTKRRTPAASTNVAFPVEPLHKEQNRIPASNLFYYSTAGAEKKVFLAFLGGSVIIVT